MTKIDDIEQTLTKVVEIQSSIQENFDDALKKMVKKGIQETIKQVKKEADTNQNDKVSVKEGITYVGKMFNGEGFKVLLITLFSVIFQYFYDYALSTYFMIESNNPLTFIGGLVFASILTYAYKNVMNKVDSTYADILEAKDKRIRELETETKAKDETIQADRLAIELLKHDCDYYEKEIHRLTS